EGADAVEVLEARACVGAVAGGDAVRGEVGVVVDLAELDIFASERAFGGIGPLAAEHFESAGRTVEGVVMLVAAGDGEDGDEVALTVARVDHDDGSAVGRALRVGLLRFDVDDAREGASRE